MKKLILLINLLWFTQSVFAQFTKVENPESFYLGYLGVVEHRDTLFTTTRILSGFDDDGVKLYYSTDNGSTWLEVQPESGFFNQGIEITSPAGLYGSDSLLALAMRRAVIFSTDAGKNWIEQTEITSTDDKERGRIFLEIDNVVLAGTANDLVNDGTGIYRKEGDGNWQLITEGFFNGNTPNVVQLDTDGSRIYVSADDGFYISDDKGLSYSRTIEKSIKDSFARIGNTILAASSGGGRRDLAFWYSEDRGETFSQVIATEVFGSGIITTPGIKSMTSSVTHFFIGITYDDFFNDGTDGGVWMSSDGNEWTRIGLEGSSVTFLSIHNNRLFATVSGNSGEDRGLYYISLDDINTSIEKDSWNAHDFNLKQNYPNPFNPNTTISFQINGSSYVNLEVFNILGQNVATLVNQYMLGGNHSVNFDATDLSSGTYFYSLRTKFGSTSKTMTLIK